jgi:beta-barrel assembly-enhancing protease
LSEHRPSKLKGLAWVLVGCSIGAGLALGLSPLAHAVPWRWERKLGAALQMDTTEACGNDARAEAALAQMLRRLYPIAAGDDAFSIDVHVVKNPAVNAYAALGGRIVVNSGLIEAAQSAEEVAGVLAHEIEHVHHRHILQGFLSYLFTSEGLSIIFGGTPSAGLASYFVTMDFSRRQEAEADEGGLRRLQEAHIDNRGFKAFFERLEQSRGTPSFLSDHPSDRSRIEMAERFENRDVTPVLTAEEWKSLKGSCSAQ